MSTAPLPPDPAPITELLEAFPPFEDDVRRRRDGESSTLWPQSRSLSWLRN